MSEVVMTALDAATFGAVGGGRQNHVDGSVLGRHLALTAFKAATGPPAPAPHAAPDELGLEDIDAGRRNRAWAVLLRL